MNRTTSERRQVVNVLFKGRWVVVGRDAVVLRSKGGSVGLLFLLVFDLSCICV